MLDAGCLIFHFPWSNPALRILFLAQPLPLWSVFLHLSARIPRLNSTRLAFHHHHLHVPDRPTDHHPTSSANIVAVVVVVVL
jgi:hypothetical protein